VLFELLKRRSIISFLLERLGLLPSLELGRRRVRPVRHEPVEPYDFGPYGLMHPRHRPRTPIRKLMPPASPQISKEEYEARKRRAILEYEMAKRRLEAEKARRFEESEVPPPIIGRRSGLVEWDGIVRNKPGTKLKGEKYDFSC